MNILQVYIFNTLILLSISREIVNQLWQTVCKLIETYKLVLDATVELCQQRLYNNNNNILLIRWFCAFTLYY